MTSEEPPVWPAKAREILNHHSDSTVWNSFQYRDGDIVIASYAKSGTTWVQQIVAQLIFDGAEGIDVHTLSPWFDFRLLAPELRAGIDRQTHRRFLKTHLPVNALVFSPLARYIYVGRDGRDTAWSYHHHHFNHTDEALDLFNRDRPAGLPPLSRGPADPYEFYLSWINGNGYPIWPFWEHVRSWWSVRHLPNVLLLHFNELKADLEGSIGRIAAFLDIAVDSSVMPQIVRHCTFDYMKRHAAEFAPRGGIAWRGGAATFINKGSNGRWRDRLTPDDNMAYELRAGQELGCQCAHWLATGEIHDSGDGNSP
jgi:aryl sulfotransferase